MDFEEIYKTYFKSVYKYIRQFSGNEHIAEEITSETFFKAMQSADKFRGECDVRVWLCQIAKNTYRSYLKKNKKTISIDDDIENTIDSAQSVEDKVAERGDARRIRDILHEIPQPYKEVFMWRVFGELSFKEIGELFNKTDNWACVTYYRAKKMIQSRLEGSKNEK